MEEVFGKEFLMARSLFLLLVLMTVSCTGSSHRSLPSSADRHLLPLQTTNPAVREGRGATLLGPASFCLQGCQPQAQQHCTIKTGCSRTLGSDKNLAPLGVPENFAIQLARSQDSNDTKVIVTWRLTLNSESQSSEEGFGLREDTIAGMENNGHESVCELYQFDDADDQAGYTEIELGSCRDYKRAFYLLSVHSVPESGQGVLYQHAIISIKERFHYLRTQYGSPDHFAIQMVIYNDSCSQRVTISFLQAPNDYNFETYMVMLIMTENGRDCTPFKDCKYKPVQHDVTSAMNTLAFENVTLGKQYFVRIQGRGTRCVCIPKCTRGQHCVATESGLFHMPLEHPSCKAPKRGSSSDGGDGSSISEQGVILLCVVGGSLLICAVLFAAFLFWICRRRLNRSRARASTASNVKVCLVYPSSLPANIAEHFRSLLQRNGCSVDLCQENQNRSQGRIASALQSLDCRAKPASHTLQYLDRESVNDFLERSPLNPQNRIIMACSCDVVEKIEDKMRASSGSGNTSSLCATAGSESDFVSVMCQFITNDREMLNRLFFVSFGCNIHCSYISFQGRGDSYIYQMPDEVNKLFKHLTPQSHQGIKKSNEFRKLHKAITNRTCSCHNTPSGTGSTQTHSSIHTDTELGPMPSTSSSSASTASDLEPFSVPSQIFIQ